MMYGMRWAARLFLPLVVLAPAWGAPGEDAGAFPSLPLTRQLMFSSVHLKEDADRPWQLRIVGTLPRGPGLLFMVYNEAGDFVARAEVPWGTHPADKPFVVDIPADGKAQQYVLRVVGQQDNYLALQLPLTDLPFEVYGGSGYALEDAPRGHARMVAFQPCAGVTTMHFVGGGSHYRILNADGSTLADTKDSLLPEGDPRKKRGLARDWEMIVPVEPGKTYWYDPVGVRYFGTFDTALYVTFDPRKWFEPRLDWTLDSRPWWKGTVNVD